MMAANPENGFERNPRNSLKSLKESGSFPGASAGETGVRFDEWSSGLSPSVTSF